MINVHVLMSLRKEGGGDVALQIYPHNLVAEMYA